MADITIDLSTAEQDPATGQFCVVQKVRMMFVAAMMMLRMMIMYSPFGIKRTFSNPMLEHEESDVGSPKK